MYLYLTGPPNSPPMDFLLLINKTIITMRASEQKIVTENAKL